MTASLVWSFWVVCGRKVVVHLLDFGERLGERMGLMLLVP